MDMKKTIIDLQKEQYGEPIAWYRVGDTFYDTICDCNYFKYFDINYQLLNTRDLLKCLHILRLDYNKDKNHLNRFETEFLKRIIAIKRELSTREHIPNKKERKEIRQKKAK